MRARLLLLLGGQTIALGLMTAFLVVPASSLFLVEYGAARLPWTYLGVAVAGVLVSWAMGVAQRHWSLLQLSVTVLGGLAALTLSAWLLLVLRDATWVTFGLLVLFPLSIPLGFVIVGSQAGRLLDLQQLKRHFARVAAGFSVGFAVGGFAAAAAARVVGDLRHLLLVDLLANLGFMALVLAVGRAHPDELRARPSPVASRSADPSMPRRRLSALEPLVLLVFGYQLLSAAVTQLLDYLVWERASVRYPDEHDLAAFLGSFGAVMNVISIAFVALFAGRLLGRYGVRFGLALNPVAVVALLVPALVVGATVGAAGLAFLLLVCASQISDIATTDGTTRTSVNATYQALPAGTRLRAQTLVEAAGVPLSVGFVGGLLLLFQALDLGVRVLATTTAGLCVVWLVLALLAYRAYSGNLRDMFRRRDWDPVALRADDPASMAAVESLLASEDPTDLRLGLDVLLQTESPRLTAHALRLLHDDDPERRGLGIDLAQHTGNRALVHDLVGTATDSGVPIELRRRAAAIAVTLVPDAATAAPLLDTDDAVIRLTADATRADAPLLRAALDRTEARFDALSVLAMIRVPTLVDALVAGNQPGPTSEEFLAALVQHGPLLPASAVSSDVPADAALRAVAAGSTPPVNAALLEHAAAHVDRDVAAAAVMALATTGVTVDAHLVDSLVERETRHARRVRAARAAVEAGSPVHRALTDELDETARRLGCYLTARHGAAAVRRTLAQLRSVDDRERGLAVETLLVTVGHHGRAVAAALGGDPEPPGATRGPVDVVLRELADDPDGYWDDPWLRACALYAAAPTELARELAERHVDDLDAVVRETAAWVLSR